MKDRVIVVGGGIGGLAAAALIARRGIEVTVLERRREVGGRAATLAVGGYSLTEGAHALYLGGPGYRLLRSLGIDPAGGTPDAAHGKVLRSGELHPAPFGPAPLLTTPLLSLKERLAAAALLSGLGRRSPREGAGISAREWIDRNTSSPVVSDLLTGLVRLSTYTGALDELAAEVAILQVRLAVRENVRYLDGGWGALSEALRAAAERAGALIRTGATVEAVRGGPQVRLAGGETLPARAVVLAGLGPAAVSRLTGARVEADGPPVEAACLDVALESLPCPENAWTLGLDEPLYVSAYSRWSRIAPEGGAVVHVARHLPTGGSAPRQELEAALDRVQPGWRDRLVHANFLPRMSVVSSLATPAKSLGGRPGPGATGIPGVHVAGDWVGPTGWLADAALASAAAAAAAVGAAWATEARAAA